MSPTSSVSSSSSLDNLYVHPDACFWRDPCEEEMQLPQYATPTPTRPPSYADKDIALALQESLDMQKR